MAIINIVHFLRIVFAFSTIFFTLIWNRSGNRFASRAAELKLFSSYPDAKNFLNRGTLLSVVGFLISLTVENSLYL